MTGDICALCDYNNVLNGVVWTKGKTLAGDPANECVKEKAVCT